MGTSTLISSQDPQNTWSPQFKLVVTEDTSNSTATTARLKYSFYYLTNHNQPAYVSSRPYTIKINGSVVKTDSAAVNGITASSTTIFSDATVDVAKINSAKDVAISFEVEWGVTWTGVYKATHSASGTISISAKTYTVSYNANNGSGAPGSQTKTGGKDLTLSSTIPTRTGYTFKNWNTKSDGTGTSYSSGGTYKTNASATLYAQWTANTYQVTYNANNGSGAPSAQTKTYGVSLNLSSTKPTRSGYDFVAWNTKSDGTGTTYQSGGSYTTNAAVTLYAVWQVSYYPPTITGLSAVRCTDSTGATEDIYNGQYVKIRFNWSCNQNKGTNNLRWITFDGYTVPPSAITGTQDGSVTYTLPNKTYTPETSHRITVVVADTFDSTTVTVSVTSATYMIDFKAGGKGVCVGGVATKDRTFECVWPAEFPAGATVGGTSVVTINTLLDVIYPIGSIYMSVNSTSPQSFLGGTWERIKGKFLFAGNDVDSPKVGNEGGAATVTLATGNLPSHNHGAGTLAASSAGAHQHDITAGANSGGSTTGIESYASAYSTTRTISKAAQSAGSHPHTITGSTGNTGSGTAFSIMPPYLAVYVWKRTA